ncbi:MAG: DUF2934 domain-containing protein [Anaerolineae bacterium]|nr:DUF2934 domain-containing protein [Phycisphaerae bacterium]
MARKPQSKSTSAARKGNANNNGKRYSAPVKSASKMPIKTPVKTTAVRNTALPKTPRVATTNRVITHELIAERAYFISISSNGGSQDDNWNRAERELRNGG